MALEAGALDAIAAKKGEKITAEELAKETGYDGLLIGITALWADGGEPGADGAHLARIMRLVTYCGVCDEVGENTYAGNEMTRLITTPGLSGGEKHQYVCLPPSLHTRGIDGWTDPHRVCAHSYDMFFPVGAKLVPYMHETGVHQFPISAAEPSPLQYATGWNFWDYFDNNPDQRKYFDDYMATRRVGLASWFETFPINDVLIPQAKKEEDAVLFVDVGGNWGHEAAALKKAYPHAPGRVILQDLPAMVQKVLEEEPPEGVECIPYDFFTEQPVKGARAYYFRNICHDWPDEACVRFLSNTAKAMEKGYSRILIDEYVLPDTRAPIRGSSMDFLMLMFCSGIERTRHQWEDLLDRCGLQIVRVWGGRSDYEQVIEAELKT